MKVMSKKTSMTILIVICIFLVILFCPLFNPKLHRKANIQIYEVNCDYTQLGIKNCGLRGELLLHYISDNDLYISNKSGSFNEDPLIKDVRYVSITSEGDADRVLTVSSEGKFISYLYLNGELKQEKNFSEYIPDTEKFYICYGLEKVTMAVSDNYLIYDNGSERIIDRIEEVTGENSRISKIAAYENFMAFLCENGDCYYFNFIDREWIKRENIVDICTRSRLYCYAMDAQGYIELLPEGGCRSYMQFDGIPQKIQAGSLETIALYDGKIYGYEGNLGVLNNINFKSIIRKYKLKTIDDFFTTMGPAMICLVDDDKIYVIS